MNPIAESITDWGFYFFMAVFSTIAIWEGMHPLRGASQPLKIRWLNNFLWLAASWLTLRLLFPFSTIQWGAFLDENQWGLLNYLSVTSWLKVLLGFLALDLGSYLLHILFHKSTVLWRFHAIHHCDTDFDCTTGFRFHPLEVIVYFSWRIILATILGIGAFSILIYEFWVGLQNLYGHANASFPLKLERYLRRLVVTPDMHRTHHSANQQESQSNFGIILPWWDYLFRSYQAPVHINASDMHIGLDPQYLESKASVPRLLLLPFSKRFSETSGSDTIIFSAVTRPLSLERLWGEKSQGRHDCSRSRYSANQ